MTKKQVEFLTGKDKPFFIDTFRKLLGQYDNDEITLSKLVEVLNLTALEWHNQHPTPQVQPQVQGKYSWEKLEGQINACAVWHIEEGRRTFIATCMDAEKAHFLATAANSFNQHPTPQVQGLHP